MFKHDNGNDTTSPQPPDMPETPRIPAIRAFSVRRYSVTEIAEDGSAVIDTVLVQAHVVQHTATGGLIFNEYVIDPVEGPTRRTRRGFSEWIDFEEILTAPSTLTIQ